MRLIRLLKYDLARDISAWVGEGIITAEQAASICSRYGVNYYDQSRRSYGYNILVVLGCLFIGLSLITLIGANWDQIPRAARMSGLIALTLGANCLGLHNYRIERTSTAVAWFFLGSLFYGASIMLIAQIYHIDEHYPDGIFWWAMGVLPIALLLESTLNMILALCLGYIWFFVEASLDFYPSMFPVFLAAAYWHLARSKQSNILFLLLISGLAVWAEFSLAWFMTSEKGFTAGIENVSLAIGIFLVLHGLSRWLAQREESALADYGVLLGVWVLRFAIITLFAFSFKYSWVLMIKTGWKIPAFSTALSIFLSLIALWLVYKARQSLVSTVVFVTLFMASLLALALVQNSEYAQAFQFADNIVLVAAGLWLTTLGIQRGISHYFYLGVFTILATGLLRYIDFVGDYIGTAILFGIQAAVLLAAAKYWKFHSARAEAAS